MKTSLFPDHRPFMHLWTEGLMDQSDLSVRRQQMVTVMWMRTLALAAQVLLLAVVGLLLHVSLPWPVLTVILGALVLLNVITFIRLRQGHSVGSFEVAAQLFADLAAFTFVLYFTGGVTNPFVSLYLPLLGLAAALLPWAQVAVLALFSVVAYTVLMGNYIPLVLANPDDGVHFHLVGMWLNFLVSVLILVGFVARLSSSIRNRDQALGRAQQRLASESRLAALGNQAASIAHQLGTPVSTIATIVSDWKNDPAMQAQLREMNVLSAQVQSITDTLGQLRDQIEVNPRHNADAQMIKPSEWLQNTLGIWRTRNPQHEVRLMPSIASIAGEFKVRKELLELGLITLLDNAAQSQQRASVRDPLQVGMQCDHESLTLFVNDAGGGIDAELLPKIGQQLFQANGQGMGLFLLANLLEREGGKLSLRNLNPGVCASLSLPVVAAMTRSILIVDDDEVFANTLALSFERKGFKTDVAFKKEQALLAAGQQQFTDITLDLNLGEQSGLQLITQLRSLQPSANILILTGYASIATTVQAIKLGADNYLAKPADSAAVLRALDDDSGSVASNDDEASDFQPMSVSRLEWEHIQRVLNEHEGNVSATARALNMHRRTLQRKLAKRPVGR